MNIEKKKQYTFISSTEKTFKDFHIEFNRNHSKLAKEHLIIKLSNFLNITCKEILLLLSFGNCHKKNGTTFVVVYANINIEDFPENVNIVPTLVEAEDVLEMENIERKLGF